MTTRERFIRTILLEEVDRPPFWIFFGPWGTTLQRWMREGLTGGWNEGLDLDPAWHTVPVNLGMYPPFERQVLKETETEIVVRDEKGVVKRDKKDGSSMPEWLDYPVKNENDWAQLKEQRFNPDSPERFSQDFEALAQRLNAAEEPVWLGYFPYGVFGTPRDLMGVESLLMDFIDRPDLVRQIMNDLTDFWLRVYEKVAAKVRVDCIHIWEDMCFKSAMLISPAMFDEFMAPCYRRIADFAQAHDIPVLSVDTDGNCMEIADNLVNVGVNVLWPLERASDNDPREFRRRWPQLALMGGFDKRAIAAGGNWRDEEFEMIRQTLQLGGYIPSPDHLLPHDISLTRFREYAALMRKVIKHE